MYILIVTQTSAKSLNLGLNLHETNCAKLLRYKMNNKGPKIVPCGTPEITGNQEENEPFKTTRC